MQEQAIETRRFDSLDEFLDMKERGGISIVRMSGGNAGMHAVFEPGWTWEADEKPLLGFPEFCPMQHTGYCISGKLVVRMINTGLQARIGTGHFFEILRGHNAYVDGDERVELILFAPAGISTDVQSGVGCYALDLTGGDRLFFRSPCALPTSIGGPFGHNSSVIQGAGNGRDDNAAQAGRRQAV